MKPLSLRQLIANWLMEKGLALQMWASKPKEEKKNASK